MFPLALTVERTGELHIHHLSKLKVCFDCFNLWGKGAFKGPICDIQPQSGRSGDNYLLHKDIVEQRRPELPLLGANIGVKTVFAWKKGYWTFNTSKVAQVRRNTSTCIMLPTLLVTEANTGQYVHPLTCTIYLQHHFAQSTKGYLHSFFCAAENSGLWVGRAWEGWCGRHTGLFWSNMLVVHCNH